MEKGKSNHDSDLEQIDDECGNVERIGVPLDAIIRMIMVGDRPLYQIEDECERNGIYYAL